jgi:transglutaminase-like putative cysteine protease
MDTTNETSLPLPRPGRLKLLVHGFMLTVFTITSVAPSAHAFAGGPGIFNGLDQVSGGSGGGDEDEERYVRFFERARAEVAAVAGKPDKYGRLPAADRQESARENLGELLDELGDIESAIEDEFDEVGKLVRSKKLPKSIRARHDAAFASVTGEFEAVRRDIRQVRNERDPKKRKSLAEGLYRRLDSQRFERSQQEFDPAELPNSTLKPDENNAPRLTEDDYIASGLVGNPIYRVAQAGGYNIANLPGASDPAFLAATDEVVLTDDIRAKATELGNEPVRIYEWVRNNVQWAPTWGAIQDASHTLSSRRGNAFDISSLTIALLRAAGYPARYVHGTIDVPEAAFRNWAGGFENINAAMEFASAGGIPLGPVTSAGRITKVRMEHIWVEAAIDFHPSRGTRNREADTWVAMDPGFKQIQILPVLENAAIQDPEAATLMTSYLNSGIANDAEGWAAGYNRALLQQAIEEQKEATRDHVESQMPGATPLEILGGRIVAETLNGILPSSLPNRIVTTGARYALLPASLQQSITFAFGKDALGEPVNPRRFSWAPLNGAKVLLSFRPATPEDDATLRAFFPEGAVSDLSQLPSSFPAYLVQVVPQLTVDGAVIMSGPSMALGAELNFVFAPTFAGRGARVLSYKLPAGSSVAVAVVGGSVSRAAVDQAQAALDATRAMLESGQPVTLTRDNFAGSMFHFGVLSYYAQYIAHGRAFGLQPDFRGFHELAAGIGSFGYEPKVDYLFGVPRTLRRGGVTMNAPIVNIVGNDAGPDFDSTAFTLGLGMFSSALEHLVPEQMFSTPSEQLQGVSAVKALSLASAAGQRIYFITPQNQAQILPLIQQDAATIGEIRQALASGRSAITHTQPISVPGWAGAGYVLLDEATGSAAWKIGGGANGSFLTGLFLGAAVGIMMMEATLVSGGAVAVILPVLLSILINAAMVAAMTFFGDSPDLVCFFVGFLTGVFVTFQLPGIGRALGPMMKQGLKAAAQLPGFRNQAFLAALEMTAVFADPTGDRRSCLSRQQ